MAGIPKQTGYFDRHETAKGITGETIGAVLLHSPDLAKTSVSNRCDGQGTMIVLAGRQEFDAEHCPAAVNGQCQGR
jgi:hypothetical protein